MNRVEKKPQIAPVFRLLDTINKSRLPVPFYDMPLTKLTDCHKWKTNVGLVRTIIFFFWGGGEGGRGMKNYPLQTFF